MIFAKRYAADREHFHICVPGRGVILHGDQQVAQLMDCPGRVGVLRAVDLAIQRGLLLEQRPCGGIILQLLQDVAERLQRHERLFMLLT